MSATCNIRIKRKRTDDPLDALYVETSRDPAGTRQSTTRWKFRRLTTEHASSSLQQHQSDCMRITESCEDRIVYTATEINQQVLPDGPGDRKIFELSRKRPGTLVEHADVGSNAYTESNGALGEGGDMMQTMLSYASESLAAHTPDTQKENTSGTQEHSTKSSDDEFVWDTYFCQMKGNANPAESRHLADVDAGDVTNFGFLILREEDSEFLHGILDEPDQVDEIDWDSEQDDENAENFYGADYPEDELEGDDEDGTGTYKLYRHGSDSEEWDVTNESWSDDEQFGRKAWRRRDTSIDSDEDDETVDDDS